MINDTIKKLVCDYIHDVADDPWDVDTAVETPRALKSDVPNKRRSGEYAFNLSSLNSKKTSAA